MESNALRVSPQDNVAVATRAIPKGEAVVIAGKSACNTVEDIRAAHKVALAAVAAGGKVIRYGEVIIEAAVPIASGAWVHVHNTRPVTAEGLQKAEV